MTEKLPAERKMDGRCSQRLRQADRTDLCWGIDARIGFTVVSGGWDLPMVSECPAMSTQQPDWTLTPANAVSAQTQRPARTGEVQWIGLKEGNPADWKNWEKVQWPRPSKPRR